MRLIDADALMQEFAEFVRDSNNSDFADVPTWNDAVSLLGSAPTIEERKKGKRCFMDDLISRQAAIDKDKRDCVDLAEHVVAMFYDEEHEEWTQKTVTIADVLDSVCDEYTILPSAEPEPLTDKEQRIFLAAMRREEDVCKQVDAEWRHCREPYEDSLVRTCREIIRKVKGALWTI